MRKIIFARSPGLMFASASVFSGGPAPETLNHGKLEQEQRLVKLSTGSPSLNYDLEIVEESEPELAGGGVSWVEFGLQITNGLVVRDGYPFESQDAALRSFVLALPDGYYRVRAQALPTIVDGQMRIRLSVRPSSLKVPEALADLDYLPPA